ncbi:uncharacterized protein [Ambystoma mexicanum]|uniref:uncharacterized protein n=1 Tax=Ambystoma mexicanum TaxID=8296 RepID=UPI0037E8D763
MRIPIRPSTAMKMLKVTCLTWATGLPTRTARSAIGYDLYRDEDVVFPGRKVLVRTGLKIEFHEGIYGKINSRSGLAHKHSLDVGTGIIEKTYISEIKVTLFNLGDYTCCVRAGQAIAQRAFERAMFLKVEDVQVFRNPM